VIKVDEVSAETEVLLMGLFYERLLMARIIKFHITTSARLTPKSSQSLK